MADLSPNSALQTLAENVDRAGPMSGLELGFVAHIEQECAIQKNWRKL
jgi:hypothetical protein